jgi:hypothetical protein
MTEVYIIIFLIVSSLVILTGYAVYKIEYNPNLKNKISMNNELKINSDDRCIKAYGNTFLINFYHHERMETRNNYLFPFIFESNNESINLIYGKRSDDLIENVGFIKFYTLMYIVKKSKKSRSYKTIFYLQIILSLILAIYVFILGYIWVSISLLSFPSIILQIEYYIYVRFINLKILIKKAKENNIDRNELIAILNTTMHHQDTVEYYKRNKKTLQRLLKVY